LSEVKMSILYNEIPISQLKEEDRWDVSFNVEIKSLSEREIDLKSIDEISEHITNGATPFGAQFPNEGVNFFRANDVKRFFFDLFEHKHITKEQSETLKRSILKPGDVVFTIKGKVGDVAVFPKGQEESNINQDNALIRLKKGHDPHYFASIFNSKFGLNQVKAFATETINPFLGIGNLKKLKIPILEEEFTQKISEKVKLSNENNLKSLEKIKEAQSIFYNAINVDFSKIKLQNVFSVNLMSFKEIDLWTPKGSYPLYIETIGAIKKNILTVSLKDIATSVKGNEVGSANYNKYLHRKETDIPFIRTSDIVNYEADQYPDFYIPQEIYDELEQDIKPGDVLYNNDGKIGPVAMLMPEDKVILQSHVKRIRLTPEAVDDYGITQEYLFLVLTIEEIGIYQAERFKVIQSTIPTISKRIMDFEIPILDRKTIEEITSLVKEAFELKNKNKIIIKEIIHEVDSLIG